MLLWISYLVTIPTYYSYLVKKQKAWGFPQVIYDAHFHDQETILENMILTAKTISFNPSFTSLSFHSNVFNYPCPS